MGVKIVPKPEDHSVIGTKWIFKNKLDESGNVVRNKDCVVSQGYVQEEGIDFDKSYASVARIESIRMFLAYASCFDLTVFQMDVKSAFFEWLCERGDLCQAIASFEDFKFPNHVFKLKKALYGLKQAPRAWYD